MEADKIRYEIDTCKLVLTWMAEENNDLKKRLSDLLAAIFSPNLIAQAECYHNRFINQDRAIARLRRDITEFERLLETDDCAPDKENCARFNSLRIATQAAENDLISLKREFLSYLYGIA